MGARFEAAVMDLERRDADRIEVIMSARLAALEMPRSIACGCWSKGLR
jgi:hypothetical protein